MEISKAIESLFSFPEESYRKLMSALEEMDKGEKASVKEASVKGMNVQACWGTAPPPDESPAEPLPLNATLSVIRGIKIVAFYRSACPFSNFYAPCPVTIQGHTFASSEHGYAYSKCIQSKDRAVAELILKSRRPREAKNLGMCVRGLDLEKWSRHRLYYMLSVVYRKFQQNPAARATLLSLKDHVFIEASTIDGIWGVKAGERLVAKGVIRGRNLLGIILTAICQHMSK